MTKVLKNNNSKSEMEVALDLVQRIQAGDNAAEAEMVARYKDGLSAVLFNRCKDRHLSEETAQDTWIVVLQKVRNGDVRNPEKLAAFIIQTGKNQLLMKFRARHRKDLPIDDHEENLKSTVQTPEQNAINLQLGETISRLFSGLTMKRDKELLQRFYVIGDEKSRLCEEYELSEEHFDRVIFRARQRFKKLWGELAE